MSDQRLIVQVLLIIVVNNLLFSVVGEGDLELVQFEDGLGDQIHIDATRSAELGDFSRTFLVFEHRAHPLSSPLIIDGVVLSQDGHHVIRCREVKAH